ncbi:MAG TPA: alpha/beta hydrolase-fold protein [Niabella sp.]|nr:alpha/beta hydrolase-fold protein [Niabella sp.]HQW14582.1 alpha/beta hydrolase-fold protein [Niabella sp.]HQX19723.1 alpha/beta hydrolase-fold protein [Niabella sp.]HQX41702.1 alpha/beta hydrolase-fold protein [Niabella sp.]HRB07540.1 alpha/beta hydrolase-fold protein [Niabella sp.]
MQKKWSLSFFLVLLFTYAQASKVDTVETVSQSMNKKIKAVIITPDHYVKSKTYPVVYLLHGYSDNYARWSRSEAVLQASDLYSMIIVCADGGFSSWYWDSPVDPLYKYETYVSKELVSWVDENYATIRSAKARAIAGLSMGGHGALYLAIKHPDVFGACGSMSGGVDIRPFPNNWDMAKRLGRYAEFPERWEKNTAINMLYLIQPKTLDIIIDCGTEDFFYNVNEELHRQMLLRNIQHDYITRPGGHTWPYWQNAVSYQLMFFNKFFNKK